MVSASAPVFRIMDCCRNINQINSSLPKLLESWCFITAIVPLTKTRYILIFKSSSNQNINIFWLTSIGVHQWPGQAPQADLGGNVSALILQFLDLLQVYALLTSKGCQRNVGCLSEYPCMHLVPCLYGSGFTSLQKRGWSGTHISEDDWYYSRYPSITSVSGWWTLGLEKVGHHGLESWAHPNYPIIFSSLMNFF